jgi:hypothetical protein
MRRLLPPLAALVLLAGCTGGTAPTGTLVPTAVPTSEPTAATTPPSTADPTCGGSGCEATSPAAASARVTFDGETCVYTGPTVVPSPTVLTVEFAPTDEGYAVSIVAIERGTTREEVDRVNADEGYGPAPGRKSPEWVLLSTWFAVMGTLVFPYDIAVMSPPDGKTFDQYAITCIADPWGSDKPVDTLEGRRTGAIVKVVGG